MGGSKKTDLNDPRHPSDDENQETLAAVDEGIRDAQAGRSVPIEKVREALPQWITASSSRKER